MEERARELPAAAGTSEQVLASSSPWLLFIVTNLSSPGLKQSGLKELCLPLPFKGQPCNSPAANEESRNRMDRCEPAADQTWDNQLTPGGFACGRGLPPSSLLSTACLRRHLDSLWFSLHLPECLISHPVEVANSVTGQERSYLASSASLGASKLWGKQLPHHKKQE